MSRFPFRPDASTEPITPSDVFFDRRAFVASSIRASLGVSIGAGLLTGPMTACAQDLPGTTASNEPNPRIVPPRQWPEGFVPKRNESFSLPTDIETTTMTPRLVAGSHNNYYEFLPGRGGDVWPHTREFNIAPWSVAISGECAKPTTLDLDDLQAFEHEERVYHFRCVERWAMNVPWTGFPLRKLLERVEPTAHAKYVRFETVNRPAQMPGMRKANYYPWPYHEALRIDEAMNDLTLLATGVYGEPLPKQHGAPVRLIVPWKYGFKNPKSIVKIELLRDEPSTFWQMQPHEYGFISNVNPNIPHPRWSQAESYWLDSKKRFDTPIYNGYGQYVASLYPDEPTTPQEPLRPGQVAR